MAWIPRLVTITGLVLLAHAGYSAQEHAALATQLQLPSNTLPLDICAETIIATLVVVLGLVLGSPQLRPIRWNVWAGKIEREGKAGFVGAPGDEFKGNPFASLEARPGFVDVRGGRREFAKWVKEQGK